MIRILCLHIAEKQASFRYRVAQYLPYWHDYGIELYPVCITGKNYLEKLKLALGSRNYDYVWLQRKPLAPLFTTLIANRSRLIYDYDDALYSVESYRQGKPKPTQPGSQQTIERLNRVLAKSSVILAGSDALAAYARRFNPENTYIVPTAYQRVSAVPESAGQKEQVTIGWIGNECNLFFLSLIDKATSAIQTRFPWVGFSLMCNRVPEGLETRWKLERWSRESEARWLRSIDIGIMPLADDEWSRGKCAFKLLQYMAYGKPVVASPVGANISTVIDGVSGYLAASSPQWLTALETLVLRPELRASMGRASLRHFLDTYERERVQNQIAAIMHDHFRNRRTCGAATAEQFRRTGS